MYLIGALLIMLLAVVIVALGYRGKAQAEQHHAALQQQRAEAAEAEVKQRHQLDIALGNIQQIHREELINATNPTHLAARDDFANAWSGSDRLHDTATDADHSTGAAATDSTGAAVHFINRPDLR